jgi:hypothetical protein
MTFVGFTNTSCREETAIRVDDRTQNSRFDLFTTFAKMSFEEGAQKINFCDANAMNITSFYTDLDGSFNPTSSKRSTHPATILSNVPTMLHFVDDKKCTEVLASCYSYCENTCFRSIRYDVDPAGTDDYLVRACSATDPRDCVDFPGYFRGDDPTTSARSRMFNVYLPKGKYTTTFVNWKGEKVWPSYVREFYEYDEVCPDSFEDGDVQLTTPPVSLNDCRELVRNTDMDWTNTDEGTMWLHRFGGLKLVRHGGIGASNALTSFEPSRSNTFVQYLDTRCFQLMVGSTYEINVWFQLQDHKGNVYQCDPGKDKCPEAGLDLSFGRSSMAYVDDSKSRNGFQLLTGTFQITDYLTREKSVGVFITSNKELSWYIDSVSITLV